jgi:nucleotide-binding universal stress UspA family protein
MSAKRNPKKGERPIVCGTDFSETAIEAVDVAAALARRLNVRLILLHVEEFRGLALSDPGLFEQLLGDSRQELHRHAERLRKLGTKVDEKIVSGSIFNELVDAAARTNARLLVIGAVGHGVARRLLIGSVAERAAETSSVPTLVVRPGSKLGSWLRGKRRLKVLTGYDFSVAGDSALRWLNELQALGPVKTIVVHIDWPPEEAHRLGYEGPLPLTENPAAMQERLERELSTRVALHLPAGKVILRVEPGWGRTEGHLFEMAHRDKVDLVVVGTHRRQGLERLRLGSVSRGVLHHATVSVGVIPPDKQEPATDP